MSETNRDMVNHPPHYTSHPSGIECIEVVEHLGFCVGSAIKYLWRVDLKGDAIDDLEKARWYVDREIARRKANGNLHRADQDEDNFTALKSLMAKRHAGGSREG